MFGSLKDFTIQDVFAKYSFEQLKAWHEVKIIEQKCEYERYKQKSNALNDKDA